MLWNIRDKIIEHRQKTKEAFKYWHRQIERWPTAVYNELKARKLIMVVSTMESKRLTNCNEPLRGEWAIKNSKTSLYISLYCL